MTAWKTGTGARRRQLAIALFMVSGATSLVFETVWARHLNLVFGTSQLAICTVLAAFMAGLALGSFVAARWANRITRPLLAYAVIEAFIGVYAIAFPWLMKAAEPLYLQFWRMFEPGPVVFGIYQSLVLGALLLPPTICMGATLPLLARFAATRPHESGRQVGRLYGANTLGAVLGTALAGFVLLPRLGLSATTWAAAAANGLLALAAVGLSTLGSSVESARQPPPESDVDAANGRMPALLLVAAVAGFSGLLYEVAWFRLMVLILGGSTYAFSTMLLAFLLGIGLGGWVGGSLADRSLGRGGAGRVLKHLAWLQLGVAALSWAAMYAYGELPFTFVWLYDKLEQAPGLLWPAQVLLALGVMLPPALLMGATFPYLVRAAAGPVAALARPVGHLYAANTLGAVAGAFGGGLFLLPALHVQGTVLAAASFNVLAAVVAGAAAMAAVGAVRRRRRLVQWSLAAIWAIAMGHLFKPVWNPLLMTSGMYRYVSRLEDRSRQGLLEFAVRPFKLVFYDEGLTSVVTVGRDPRIGDIWLAINGKVDASYLGDRKTQVLLAHLPFAFRPRAERGLVIGLGSGISAGSVTLHRTLSRIDVVEIEPAVVAASHAFDEHNHRPLEDPRVHLYTNDARNHLQLVPDGTYHMVTSEPSNPWLTGVSSLFTREFFALGKRKMTPDGVWTQWLHCYAMTPDDLRSLLATFAHTFAHVRMFRIDSADLVLVGSDAPLPLNASAIGRALGTDAVLAESLAAVGLRGPVDILALYQMDRDTMLRLSEGIDLNTDDNMRIEYSAPLHLHEDTSGANTRMLRSVAEVPFDAVDGAGSRTALAAAYLRDGDLRRARIAIAYAEADHPDNPKVRALADVVEQLIATGGMDAGR